MIPPLPFDPSQPPTDVPAIVRSIARESVTWNKPVFRPPPLTVKPQVPEMLDFDVWLRAREFGR
jgi:hypothetical protein